LSESDDGDEHSSKSPKVKPQFDPINPNLTLLVPGFFELKYPVGGFHYPQITFECNDMEIPQNKMNYLKHLLTYNVINFLMMSLISLIYVS